MPAPLEFVRHPDTVLAETEAASSPADSSVPSGPDPTTSSVPADTAPSGEAESFDTAPDILASPRPSAWPD